jgi:hypothetical protein
MEKELREKLREKFTDDQIDMRQEILSQVNIDTWLKVMKELGIPEEGEL